MKPVDLVVLAAIGAELEPLRVELSRREQLADLEIFEGEIEGLDLRAVVCGVGKVAAARAASLLTHPAPRYGLVMVGVCGGLAVNQSIGTLVHCSHTVQTDLHLPGRGRLEPDPTLLAAWRAVAPAPAAAFLTADRAAIMPWRRLARRLRHGSGPAVADMETAAAAWVAARAGVPWAALRSISDTQGLRRSRSFAANFKTEAPRAARTVAALCRELAARRPTSIHREH